MLVNGIELNIVVNHSVISEYYDKYNNCFVEGRRGSNYEIYVKNNHNREIKAVISVDGLNILTGDTTWEKGYVIYPLSFIKIPGWRIDNSNIAHFIFANKKISYNYHNHNSKSETGVIGALIFDRKQQDFLVHQSHMRDAVGLSSYNTNNMGTGWGHKQNFDVYEVNTEFEDIPFNKLVMYYDDAKGLEKRGIHVRYSSKYPEAFPEYSSNHDGCPPPTLKRVK